jgi:hypothetical protein
MASLSRSDQLKAEYAEKRRALQSKFAQMREKEREKQKAALARLKHRLEVLARREQLADARASQSPRKADAQAKIVIGAITMNFFTDHPNGQMSKQRIIDGLKANPRVLKNVVLRQFAHFLRNPEEAQSQETKTH